MTIVNAETEKTNVEKEAVAVEEAAASATAQKAAEQKAEVEGDLAEAMPALNDALGALEVLTQKDIGEIKAMGSPPQPVKLVLQAVCIMKSIKPQRAKDANGNSFDDWWTPSKKMVSE